MSKQANGALGALPAHALEQLPQQIFFLDGELRIVYLNKAAVDTFRHQEAELKEAYGYGVEQLLDRPLPQLCNKPHWVETTLRALQTSPRQILLDVAGRPLSVIASPAFDGAGKATGYWLSEATAAADASFCTAKVDALLEVTRVAAAGDLTQSLEFGGEGALDELGAGLGKLFAGFRTKIGTIGEMAKTLYGSAQGLSELSEKLRTSVASNSDRVRSVSSAGEEISEHIQAVAAAVEEMSVNVREIAKNAVEAARVAGEAVKVADATEDTINRLGSSSEAIGKVVKVITSIAQQTNLLALNATIEAARAGDAGKGFAVVANEVKELAKQTSSATEDIGQKVEAIQRDTKEAVSKIEQFGAIIGRVNDHQDSIAGAVEQQTTVVNEIARNLTEAAEGTTSIAENISSVAREFEEIKVGADESAGAATSLAQLGIKLQMLVKQFKY